MHLHPSGFRVEGSLNKLGVWGLRLQLAAVLSLWDWGLGFGFRFWV